MIQIRHVPDALHRKLKVRAAAAGQSLSDYLRLQVEQAAARPTLEEIRERLGRLRPVEAVEPPAVTIRRERDRP